MRVLVACEFSGIVREAFRLRGHDAVSCDLQDTVLDGPHVKGDVLEILHDGWDMMIAFPPCTYLCSSGLHRNAQDAGRSVKTISAVNFVRALMAAPIERIAVENPVGCLSTFIRKPDQIIQPYEFGEDASKRTCLWLKGLPKLKGTKRIYGRIVNGKERWSNQTDAGASNEPEHDERGELKSITYPGVAVAMAEQWGGLA